MERSRTNPLVPFTYFRPAMHQVSMGVMFLLGAVLSAYVYFTSLYLQNVLGLNVLLTGLALLPSTVTVILTSTFLSRLLLSRWGMKGVLLLGLTTLGIGQCWLSFVASSDSHVMTVLPGLLLSAFGLVLALPGVSVGATNGVARQEQGMASDLLVTSQQIGSAVGLVLLATIAAMYTEHMHGSLSSGYSLSYPVAAGILLFAIVLTATLLKRQASPTLPATQSREINQRENDIHVL